MFYFFFMHTATLKSYDMSLALKTVAQLKSIIETEYDIPKEKQILLISGGEVLQDDLTISHYLPSDSNPIFVFSMAHIELDFQPVCEEDEIVPDPYPLEKEIANFKHRAPTLDSINMMTNAALRLYEKSLVYYKVSDTMVYTQHLLQQGWAAVNANLDDLVASFKKRCKSIENSFKKHLEHRNHNFEVLKSFNEDLINLSKIPVLDCLLEGEANAEGSTTLLKWIINHDSRKNLELMAIQCSQIIEKVTEETWEKINAEINNSLSLARTENMKNVIGLEGRLYSMDQFLTTLKQLVEFQQKIADSLKHNRHKALSLGDENKDIIPDLCLSHQEQLEKMQENNLKIKDLQDSLIASKKELSSNIHFRLRWVVYTQKSINDTDNGIIIQYERLKWLKNHINIIKMIHKSPQIYFSALKEIVRRKEFSVFFSDWANKIAKTSGSLYKKEVELRNEFCAVIHNHFLKSLFPGIEDMPPPFATEEPKPFDQNLPNVLPEDLENIKKLVPEFSSFFNPKLDFPGVYDSVLSSNDPSSLYKESATKFPKLEYSTLEKPFTYPTELDGGSQAKHTSPVKRKSTTTLPPQNIDDTDSHVSTCEIAEDYVTADFFDADVAMPSISEANMDDDLAILKETPENADLIENLKQQFSGKFEQLRSQIQKIVELKEQLKELKRMYVDETNCTLEGISDLKEKLPSMINELQNKFQVQAEHLHKQLASENQEEIENQRKQMNVRINELYKINEEKDAQIAFLSQTLEVNRTEHNQELEKLHQKCQEQWQSYSSLKELYEQEKKEREQVAAEEKTPPPPPGLAEKELWGEFLAWKQAKECCDTLDCKSVIESLHKSYKLEIDNVRNQYEAELEETVFKFKQESMVFQAKVDDQSKQLLYAKGNLSNYQKQNKELSQTLRGQLDSQVLAESCTGESFTTSIALLSDVSQDEDRRFHHIYQQLEDKDAEIVRLRQKMVSHKVGDKVCLASCDAGDTVLICYEDTHRSFTIFNLKTGLFFLHPDCVEPLGLKTDAPQKNWALAEVLSKEYCQARKTNNRYMVPVGTKFYRVKVKPWSRDYALKKIRKYLGDPVRMEESASSSAANQ